MPFGIINIEKNAYGYAAHRRYKKVDPAVIIPPKCTMKGDNKPEKDRTVTSVMVAEWSRVYLQKEREKS